MARPTKLQINSANLPEGDISPAEEVFLSTKEIKRRYSNPSDMTLYRWMEDPRTRFPRPQKIGRHRFWPLSAIIAFERRLAEERGAA